MKKLLFLLLAFTFFGAAHAQDIKDKDQNSLGSIQKDGYVFSAEGDTLGLITKSKITDANGRTLGYIDKSGTVRNKYQKTLGFISTSDGRVTTKDGNTLGYTQNGKIMNKGKIAIGFYDEENVTYQQAALFFFFFFHHED